jgi:hypothetical protein
LVGLRSAAARRLRTFPVLRRYPATYVSSGVEGFRLRHDFDRIRAFVLFVGQPRTGHSLVGALLDAHPRALIAHELDALKYVASGFDRRRLFALLVRQEHARAATGHLSSAGYAYSIPDQWQGRYERLEVIGDKKGGRSTARLRADIGLLDRLSRTVGVDVHVVQVVRNPFDVIATMQRRAPKRAPTDVVELFFDLAETVDVVRHRVDPSRFHEIHLDDLIASPARTLSGLCHSLDLSAPNDYLDACSGIVFDQPRRTRDQATWTPELLARVATRAIDHSWLVRYHFDDATAGERNE